MVSLHSISITAGAVFYQGHSRHNRSPGGGSSSVSSYASYDSYNEQIDAERRKRRETERKLARTERQLLRLEDERDMLFQQLVDIRQTCKFVVFKHYKDTNGQGMAMSENEKYIITSKFNLGELNNDLLSGMQLSKTNNANDPQRIANVIKQLNLINKKPKLKWINHDDIDNLKEEDVKSLVDNCKFMTKMQFVSKLSAKTGEYLMVMCLEAVLTEYVFAFHVVKLFLTQY